LVVAISGAERATEWTGPTDADPTSEPPGQVLEPSVDPTITTVEAESAPAREVTVRDVDVLRTRLELLHDMADGDRKAREAQRISTQADLADAEQRMLDVQRDHRSIRQTLGDLASIVNRQMADGSATRATVNELRTMVLEIRDEGREAVERTQRDTRRSVEQIEAHARMDRDWIGATQSIVERLAEDLARQDRDVAGLREALARADADVLQQRATELEHLAQLREQLAEAVAAIEALGDVTKRQAGQITRLRADLKKATAAPAPKPTAKKQAPRPAAAKRAAPRSRR
jgi:septal ring factor EnvC (AmiA/AmiB activator)